MSKADGNGKGDEHEDRDAALTDPYLLPVADPATPERDHGSLSWVEVSLSLTVHSVYRPSHGFVMFGVPMLLP